MQREDSGVSPRGDPKSPINKLGGVPSTSAPPPTRRRAADQVFFSFGDAPAGQKF